MNQINHEFSLEALQAGDRMEFSRLVDATSGGIYRLALKMLVNEQDAEDVLQNTYMKALQHIRNFEGRSSLFTWLYRIAANEALMMLRKKRPEVVMTDTEPEDEEISDLIPMNFTDWCCLPEDELLSLEAQGRLDVAVQLLPEKLRIVFLLRDVEGLSIQDTSDALNLSETAVKTRLLRARLKLREQLAQYYSERVTQRTG